MNINKGDVTEEEGSNKEQEAKTRKERKETPR